jgi:hypothetical protein
MLDIYALLDRFPKQGLVRRVVGTVPHPNSLKLAADAHEIAVSYPDGVRLFDITEVRQ